MESPIKFAKPAELFRMRRSNTNSCSGSSPSPLKLLQTDPSPTKTLPVLLKNPFNLPVKRRLKLGGLSPRKNPVPNKRTRMLAVDEDANLEPPSFDKEACKKSRCRNDWALRTKLEFIFDKPCKNWNENSNTAHKRRSSTNPETPTKDRTISIEAIRNVATVYQYPYFSWQPLYPRISSTSCIKLTKDQQSSLYNAMFQDWCESLRDLTDLLLTDKCPYFYLYGDIINIFFRTTSKNPQAFLSHPSASLEDKLKEIGVEVKINPFQVDSLTTANQDSQYNSCSTNYSKVETYGELSDDEENPEDTGSILQGLCITKEDVNSIKAIRKAIPDAAAKRHSAEKPQLALVEGANNIRLLIKFLITDRVFTVTTVGDFAYIPPTLISPNEFRLSTSHQPKVVDNFTKDHPRRLIKLEGIILPSLHKELHHLLNHSENTDHSCQSTRLESSIPFSTIQI